MKLFKKIRKGFTLIELVVVIAVIAILSAVSVVSYVAITNRAKQSSDEQAVRQMNTILQANSVMDLKSINDVFAAFAENQLDVENYKPLYKDRYFFWDSDTNQIVYTDKNYVVIYPESLKGQSKADHQWYSLTQSLAKVEIKATDKVTVPDVGEKEVKKITPATSTEAPKYDYAIKEPEQLYTIGQELKEAMMETAKNSSKTTSEGIKTVNEGSIAYVVGDLTIDLTEDLDLMGAAFNFCVKGNFVLDGHGHKITGIVNNRDFVVGTSKQQGGATQEEKYGTGLLGAIKGGSAVFRNVTIENCCFGFSEGKGSGLVGYAYSPVEFDHVTMKNCVSEAYEHSSGGFVGDIQNGASITLKGENKVENCTLKLHEGTDDAKECYGAGYLVGRSVAAFSIDKTAGSFAQNGNTKVYGSNNKIWASKPDAYTKPYYYWDNAEAGVAFTNPNA